MTKATQQHQWQQDYEVNFANLVLDDRRTVHPVWCHSFAHTLRWMDPHNGREKKSIVSLWVGYLPIARLCEETVFEFHFHMIRFGKKRILSCSQRIFLVCRRNAWRCATLVSFPLVAYIRNCLTHTHVNQFIFLTGAHTTVCLCAHPYVPFSNVRFSLWRPSMDVVFVELIRPSSLSCTCANQQLFNICWLCPVRQNWLR